ncbi:UDP-3-O-(3-hydroxymyristoyl)-glucosamine N-acyltransferase [Candidatus Methylomirabilis oxygeniifera]|uniref:UDP-3-O-acylglucosamine N-acyltransferase n=1 Tax=Methylomirabilis oxygeniifera TaxID=671143 RepID=D5MG28_METO1|nr:UDP-3-O-(3-hydroxymyristoyl)-glucosamine N-acyltransferase [Candidatus Methylomirabilis oxyfera]
MQLRELAEKLNCRLVGDGEIEVRHLAPLHEACEGDLAFVAHARDLPKLETSKASAVIVPEGSPPCSKPALLTNDPYLAFVGALRLFYTPDSPTPGIHPSSIVREGVRLAMDVAIGPLSVVEADVTIGRGTVVGAQVYIGKGSRIGADCWLYPQVMIREGAEIGDRVIVHSGTVIGSDGFGYLRDGQGIRIKVPQVGRVIIEDDVEIGANVTIDRATIGATRIKHGTKIDNLVQIAHNVVVGADTVIVALTGISGSATIGDRVTLAGQVGIVDHIEIGDDVTVGAQAGVAKSLPSGSVVLGSPAVPHLAFKRSVAAANRLPSILRTLKRIETRLASLERTIEEGDVEAQSSQSSFERRPQ